VELWPIVVSTFRFSAVTWNWSRIGRNARRYSPQGDEMTLTTIWQVFIAGFAGGIVLEFFHWYSIRKEGKWPDYSSSAVYWVTSAVMAIIGGGLAVLYFGGRAEGIVALHVGLSAPLILQKLTTTVASTPGAKGTGKSVMSFLDW
jgi:hypothetical protein